MCISFFISKHKKRGSILLLDSEVFDYLNRQIKSKAHEQDVSVYTLLLGDCEIVEVSESRK